MTNFNDENSFCGDVVMDSFNMAYTDEERIEDQKYDEQIFRELYHEDFKFYE